MTPRKRISRRHVSDARIARRRRVAGVTILGFILQLFLITAHIHLDEEGWIGLPLPAGVAPLSPDHYGLFARVHEGLGHHPALRQAPGARQSDMPAAPANDHQHVKYPNCQICQTVPLASFSTAAATIEFTPAVLGARSYPIASRDDSRRIELHTRAQPRAPPIPL